MELEKLQFGVGCKTSLSSVLTELYCYQSSSSCIGGSALCRTFLAAAQIRPMSDYGQNAASRPSHLYALLNPHLFCSCLGEGGTPLSFWTCNSLSITFSFFSLAISSSGFLLSFIKCCWCLFALQPFSIYPVFVIGFSLSYHSQTSIIMPF